ncbi:hypothetical protein DL770_007218 [Monosporascus sp. CRB-9-2]|nr:hypothetical protein DL770_007218 [Monosporascus sp. CRB-9-2]
MGFLSLVSYWRSFILEFRNLGSGLRACHASTWSRNVNIASPASLRVTKEIFAHLNHSDEHGWTNDGRPTLCALALTCRSLSEDAVDLLYSHIKLEIRSCRLRWAAAPLDGGDGDIGVYDEFLDHPARSASLRELSVELSSPRSPDFLPARTATRTAASRILGSWKLSSITWASSFPCLQTA